MYPQTITDETVRFGGNIVDILVLIKERLVVNYVYIGNIKPLVHAAFLLCLARFRTIRL